MGIDILWFGLLTNKRDILSLGAGKIEGLKSLSVIS